MKKQKARLCVNKLKIIAVRIALIACFGMMWAIPAYILGHDRGLQENVDNYYQVNYMKGSD